MMTAHCMSMLGWDILSAREHFGDEKTLCDGLTLQSTITGQAKGRRHAPSKDIPERNN